ncbi:MAG: cell division protein FtsN [Candidatus Accumulibacter vicinus]|uniref:Cell division protein FtsN n=2 Tax=Candidatus Accumulibacter vicinus TaxID=2954382 RepID=A0A084Y352_9PROT|nr:MAG: cell division protein FtsN [Candidatus Accumulibacter vicinus]
MAKRPANNLSPASPALAAPAAVTPGWLGGQADLKRQLWRQMAVAALLIVAALVMLIVLDYLSSQEEEMAAGPQFTQPVPVRKPPPSVDTRPSPAEKPPLEPLAAGPQASGAALEKWLPVEPSSPEISPGNAAAAAKAGAPPVEPLATPMPRLLAGIVVQSGIVPDVRQAEAMQARFVAEGIPASIEVRLQLGPFRTRAEAEVARQKIKGLGIDGLITVGKVSRP